VRIEVLQLWNFGLGQKRPNNGGTSPKPLCCDFGEKSEHWRDSAGHFAR
jgi:hypothetical protein